MAKKHIFAEEQIYYGQKEDHFPYRYGVDTRIRTDGIHRYRIARRRTRTDHQVWHDMAVFHSIAGFSFLILAAIHVKYHWAWYKALKSKGLKNKSKIVAALSALFIIVAASGILLAFFIDGANTHVGLWHYKAGLVTGVLASLHILKRWALLRKGTASILRP